MGGGPMYQTNYQQNIPENETTPRYPYAPVQEPNLYEQQQLAEQSRRRQEYNQRVKIHIQRNK